jgi:mRNA-degrading endonuclease HigB of HigAB toxin-antitoxin module
MIGILLKEQQKNPYQVKKLVIPTIERQKLLIKQYVARISGGFIAYRVFGINAFRLNKCFISYF